MGSHQGEVVLDTSIHFRSNNYSKVWTVSPIVVNLMSSSTRSILIITIILLIKYFGVADGVGDLKLMKLHFSLFRNSNKCNLSNLWIGWLTFTNSGYHAFICLFLPMQEQ
ncbi:Cysteine desulfurase mitochondrial, variant 2 [Trifolium repens]|nr:Cysteine desulfurase mitochondrial, variant 2 [Trifolium repens]